MFMMRSLVTIAILALIVLCALPAGAGFNYSMWLAAHPEAIVADGRSETIVSAEVRGDNGDPAPDGTLVDFTTSIGTIDRTARTEAGVARARLRADTTTGTALVSAVVTTGNAVAQLRVDFLEPGTEMFDESFISISSRKYLGYDADTRTIDSAGGVKIYSRGLTITAEEAQIDTSRNVLRAKARMGGDPIVIRRGDKKVTASALYYGFNSMSGVILTPADDGAKRMKLRGRDLFVEQDDDPETTATFDFDPISESQMFIKADSILIRPGEEIKFKRASFYLEGSRVLSMPLHVEYLGSGGSSLGKVLTYGTDGLRLDLPFYYSLTPSGTGAVRLKHSQPGGWGYYSGSSGWQVDVEQEYNVGGSTDGKFTLNRVTSLNDWGARWTQRKEYNDDAQLYTYLDFPSHRSLYGNLNYSKPLGDYTMSLYLRGNKLQSGNGSYSTSANIQSRPKPLFGNAITYAFTSRLGYDAYPGIGGGGLSSSLGMQFYGRTIRFGNASSLNTSMSVERVMGGDYPGTSMNANAGYYRSLGTIGQVGLNYTYSFTDKDFGFSGHRVSTDLSLSPTDKWRAFLHSTMGIGDNSASAFGEFSYAFMPGWGIHLLGTYQKFDSYKYSDMEIALAKVIGKQEARLVWSQSRKRVRMEFSALTF